MVKSKSYSAGTYAKSWSYKKKPTEVSTHTITNQNLLKKLANWEQDRAKRYAETNKNDAGTEWLISSVDRLSGSYVSDELMERAGLVWDRDRPAKVSPDTGRIWHSFTQLPSPIRKNFLLDWEEVVDVDMSKSQIAILSKHWMKDESERSKLQAHIEAGTVYSQLDFYMGQDRAKIEAYNRKHPKDPLETTKSLMAKIIMGSPNSSWKSAKFIEKEYPVMMRSICGYKCKVAKDNGWKVALSRFALKLQREEATILSLVGEQCQSLDIPAVPIFDGLLVPESRSEVVKGLLMEVLTERLDFAPEPSITIYDSFI